MTDNVLARLAEIKTMDIVALKAMWRDLFAAEPPPYNRKFLESRLAYRIQELAYGGLKPETLKRLAALAEELEPRGSRSRIRATTCRSPARGCCANGRASSTPSRCWPTASNMQGRPYKSLSAIARAITGTRWNGWLFFGLRSQKGAGPMKTAAPVTSRSSASSAAPSTRANPRRRGSTWSSTRSMPSARPARPMSPASGRKAGCWCPTATTMAASPAPRWSGRH